MKRPLIYLLSIFTLVSISCSFFSQSINPAEVQSMVSATLTALPPSVLQPVLEATVLPMPTQPEQTTQLPPESRRPAELYVAFIGPDRCLYTWARSSGVMKIMEYGDLSDLKLSEDGTLIAFTRDGEDQKNSLWIVGFDGSNPREVMTWNDLTSLKTNPESLGTSPYNLQWIPGTHILTFTTRDVFEGPGLVLNNDLIRVDGDSGAWRIKLMPGQAGLATFSPGGRWMAISTSEKITIMNLDGNPVPGNGLVFSPVITYSEYLYYPVPVWSADGSRLAVVIPAADPLAEPRQPASVWTMDIQGGDPILQTKVVSQFIGPVTVSPDLMKLFYVKEIGLPADNRREIRTAQINGQGEFVVFTGDIPLTWNWNPNSEVFAYQSARNQAVTVSQMDGSVGFLPDTNGASWFSWVDAAQFLFSRTSGENVELFLGKWREGSQLIATLPRSDRYQIQVDFAR